MSGFSPKPILPERTSPVRVAVSEDWRRDRPGRTSKLSYILERKEFTDVTFLIGSFPNEETISAHRLVLSMFSRVFEAMFQGPLAAPPGETICVPDVDPEAFQLLLKFIYTGEFDRNIPTELGVDLLFAAHKYEVADLELVCVETLKGIVTHSNAVTIYQSAQFLNMTDLRNDVYNFIIRHFNEICLTDDFLGFRLENLVTFLEDDDCHGQEIDLYHAVEKWARSECRRREIEDSSKNVRTVANDAFMCIRYPLMSPEEFALHVSTSEILTSEECKVVLQHFVVNEEFRDMLPNLPFSSKKRNCSMYVAKFYEGMAKTAYVDISAGWYNKFSVSQPVSIISFGFYGPYSAESASYNVSIKLVKDSDEHVLGEMTNQTFNVKLKEIFHVKFPKPVFIYPGHTYRAWFAIKGPLTCHGATHKSVQSIEVPVSYSKYEHIEFTYHVTGAHQLPEIAFQI